MELRGGQSETASSMQRACHKIEALFSHKQEGSGHGGDGEAGLTDNDMRGFMVCSVSAPNWIRSLAMES